ncbi:MAG: hypothetical protein AAF990_10545 [Bacteroidota bacterium]
MRDKLENFIHQNRPDFDDRVPDPKIWDRIDQEIGSSGGGQAKVRPINRWRWLGMVASVALLIGLGMVIGMQMASKNSATETVADVDLPIIDEDVESYYRGQVNRRLQRLARYEYAAEVQSDLQEMDDFLLQLKEEFSNAPPQDRKEIVAAMIDNYKNRIELLERVLSKLESTNQDTQKKSEKDEDINI